MLPKVFAVVLNYNGFEDTQLCIESLLKCSYKNLSIVIVDNFSSDESKKLLKEKYSEIPLLELNHNGGYAYGMNFGAKYSIEIGADIVLYVNNDVVVTESFLEPMIKMLEKDSSIGMISPKVLYREFPDIIYCGGGKIDYLRCGGVAEFQGLPAKDFANNEKELTLAEGCLILITKHVFENIGFMNEKYFMYFEDVEFAERVMKKYKIMYCPQSIVYHKSGAGKDWENHSALYNYYFTRNRLWHFSNNNFFYKIYVISFSKLVVFIKTYYLFFSILKSIENRNKKIVALKSLWKGLISGILLILKIKK